MYKTYKEILNDIAIKGFEAAALDVFQHQFANNIWYNKWCNAIGRTQPKCLTEIPFLPVSFFKTKQILSSNAPINKVFKSSGTTNTTTTSQHFVTNTEIYLDAVNYGFKQQFGTISNYCVLGLLPSYLQQGNSSLVYMVNHLITKSKHKNSGFYINNFEQLAYTIKHLITTGQKIWLIGVTYALLDFFEQYPMQLNNTIVLETGGMKGRKKEMVRAQIHEKLKKNSGMQFISGEYGMTELLSHAYLQSNGLFKPIPTMQLLLRKETDPFEVTENGRGLLNIIDLANINSCSFIAADDYGEVLKNREFSIFGRIDNSDIRGCSLMYGN